MSYVLISSRSILSDRIYTILNLKNNKVEYHNYSQLLNLCLSEEFINLYYDKKKKALSGLHCDLEDYLKYKSYYTCIKSRNTGYTFVDQSGHIYDFKLEKGKKCEGLSNIKSSPYYHNCLNKNFIDNNNKKSSTSFAPVYDLSKASFELRTCYLSFMTEECEDCYESYRVLDYDNLILVCDSLYDSNLGLELSLHKLQELYKIESLEDLSLSVNLKNLYLLSHVSSDSKLSLDINESLLNLINNNYKDLDFYSDDIPGVCVTGIDLSLVDDSLLEFLKSSLI